MSEFAELQARIARALDRIGAGLELLERRDEAPGADERDAEIERLTAALEEERGANAQLEERVRVLSARQEQALAGLQAEVDRLRARLDEEEEALARMQKANEALRANNAMLRESMAAGLAEPHLVNKSMMAELAALRAARAAEGDEIKAVLAEIDEMLAAADGEETANA
ncbi:MAG: hypothetical protein D6801_03185 [Alphaproteobacteria bacterium]|nr:MAG: hypothetical protein D6801_03185 [Alphaproteobacteria bacterium]